MTITQLNELFMEMEVLIRELSETLISELALRDELEYEKELKNSFISLLLAVQNRRRQYHVEKKKHKAQNKAPTGESLTFIQILETILDKFLAHNRTRAKIPNNSHSIPLG